MSSGSLRQAGSISVTLCGRWLATNPTSHVQAWLRYATRSFSAMGPCKKMNAESNLGKAGFDIGRILYAPFQQQQRHFAAACAKRHCGGNGAPSISGKSCKMAAGALIGRKVSHQVSASRVFKRPATHAAGAEAAGESVESPTWKQLRALALHGAIPMVGFGIMDQTIMIQAGDFIDNTIGRSFALPTLAAAACGQVFSDFSGVLFGSTVEAMAGRMGLPVHGLSAEQLSLPISKKWQSIGAAIGVVCGCLLGMTQILFMDLKRDQRLQEFSQLETILAEIMTHDATALSADRSALYLVDHEEEKVWTVSQSTGSYSVFVEMSWNKGISGASARTGKLLNIPDAYECPYFNKEYDLKSGEESFRTRSVLAVPVTNRSDGKVFAVLQFINKRDADDNVVPFSKEDVDAGQEMAKLLAILRPTLQNMMEGF